LLIQIYIAGVGSGFSENNQDLAKKVRIRLDPDLQPCWWLRYGTVRWYPS